MELMIAVAILGVLASISITSFQQYIYKSQSVQGLTLLNELVTGTKAHWLEYHRIPDATLTINPNGAMGTHGLGGPMVDVAPFAFESAACGGHRFPQSSLADFVAPVNKFFRGLAFVPKEPTYYRIKILGNWGTPGNVAPRVSMSIDATRLLDCSSIAWFDDRIKFVLRNDVVGDDYDQLVAKGPITKI